MPLPDPIPAPALPPAFAPRPLRLAVLLSIGVHAMGLWLIAATFVAAVPSVELIRVALRPGGGSPAGPAPAADPAGVVAPAAGLPPPPLPRQERVRARPAVAPAPKPAPARPRRAPRIVARPPGASTADAPPPAAADTAAVQNPDAAAVGTGAGTGSGSGPGGGGAGSGRGGGTDLGDQRAACVFCPEPVYPLIARRRGWQGTVDVGLVLLADGRVDSAQVRQSSGFAVLDREALEVARRSRFRLANVGGNAVVGEIKYRFELVDAD